MKKEMLLVGTNMKCIIKEDKESSYEGKGKYKLKERDWGA